MVLWIDLRPQMLTLLFMGVCAFVASGLNFDVDRYLQGSPFKARNTFRKGQIPPKDNPEDNQGQTQGS